MNPSSLDPNSFTRILNWRLNLPAVSISKHKMLSVDAHWSLRMPFFITESADPVVP